MIYDMFYNKPYNTIRGTLTVKNKLTGEVISVKSDISDENEALPVIEELLEVLNFHKDIDFESCISEMVINIFVAEGEYPKTDISRICMGILDKINCQVVFNIHEDLIYLKYEQD